MKPVKVVTFGRSSQNDVVLNDAKVSRVHCQIVQYDNGSFAIIDFDSANGTYVNGRSVVGTMTLNWTDLVVIGNTTIQWQYYFKGSDVTTGTGGKPKSSALPPVLGVVGGVIGVAAIVLLILLLSRGQGDMHSSREYHIGGVSLDFNMSQEDLFNENPNANIVAKHAPSGALPAHDYYVVNNNMAVTFEQASDVQESHINQIVVWDPSFVIHNIHVGDPCSKMLNEYDVDKSTNNARTLSFWYVNSWYDYRSERFTGAICVYDAATCTGYLLFKNEFSASLWQGVTAAAGYVASTGEISFAALSASTYQSIYSSVTVSQIVKYNCNKGYAASPFGPSASVNSNSEYVDLGLPSGTLWKSQNESGYYDYDEAVQQFGSSLPTDAQLKELVSKCHWVWLGNGYRVDGPNGNSIIIPADGMYGCDGSFSGKGESGEIWTSAMEDGFWAYSLNSNNSYVNVSTEGRCSKLSVRLVKKGGSRSNTPSTDDQKYPHDASGTIPYNSEMFDQGSTGVVALSNGDVLHYKFVKDMDFFPTWKIEFSMEGVDVRKKYKVAALKSLDAEEAYVGDDDDYYDKIKVMISVGGFVDIGKEKLYVIVKRK